MARKSPSRLDKRREAEAAENLGTEKVKKATVKRKTKRRTKAVNTERKRMVWVIYSGSLKEEGRFNYDQKDEALEKIELLRSKSKKLYFLQPVKEVIGQEAPRAKVVVEDDEELDNEAEAAEDTGVEDEEAVEPEEDLEEEDAFDDDSDDDAGGDDFSDDD